MNAIWNLHELLHRGNGVITEFVNDRKLCSKKAEGKFDAALDYLVAQDKSEWSRPHASPLSDGLYMIRFIDENRRQLRVFGHFDDEYQSFVMTLQGGETDGEYYPKDYKQRISHNRESILGQFFAKTQSFDNRCGHNQCGIQ